MWDLVASSAEVADSNQQNTLLKCDTTSLQSVFGLSLLGYGRNKAVQHAGKGPASSADVRGSF